MTDTGSIREIGGLMRTLRSRKVPVYRDQLSSRCRLLSNSHEVVDSIERHYPDALLKDATLSRSVPSPSRWRERRHVDILTPSLRSCGGGIRTCFQDDCRCTTRLESAHRPPKRRSNGECAEI